MARYQIQTEADLDIDEIYADGIKEWGLAQARSYLLGLHERFEFLADNPNIGVNSDELAPNLQRFRYGLSISVQYLPILIIVFKIIILYKQ